MRKSEAMRRIKAAQIEAQKLIAGHASLGGKFAPALSSEGYNGGYRDALSDVMLLLNNCDPCCRREFWKKSE